MPGSETKKTSHGRVGIEGELKFWTRIYKTIKKRAKKKKKN